LTPGIEENKLKQVQSFEPLQYSHLELDYTPAQYKYCNGTFLLVCTAPASAKQLVEEATGGKKNEE
jgi:hypothetical protein